MDTLDILSIPACICVEQKIYKNKTKNPGILAASLGTRWLENRGEKGIFTHALSYHFNFKHVTIVLI